jgi:hypothetical protein
LSESRLPKLLKTLKREVKEWRLWNRRMCFEGRCSIQLSYGRTVDFSNLITVLAAWDSDSPKLGLPCGFKPCGRPVAAYSCAARFREERQMWREGENLNGLTRSRRKGSALLILKLCQALEASEKRPYCVILSEAKNLSSV